MAPKTKQADPSGQEAQRNSKFAVVLATVEPRPPTVEGEGEIDGLQAHVGVQPASKKTTAYRVTLTSASGQHQMTWRAVR